MTQSDFSLKADVDFLRLKVIKNPFDTSDVITEELQYDALKTLAGYLDGLPNRDSWLVGYNGLVAKPAIWKDVKPAPGDMITLTRIPEGGDGAKNILRIVALIAVAVFAAWAAPFIAGALGLGAGAAAVAGVTAAIAVGGSMLVNALLPPPSVAFDKGNTVEESPSFGIDGPKNTAREGLPVPVGYGEFRVGGNLSDIYTVNTGDIQYLYLRSIINDGRIEGYSDIEINDQPIANFTDVQVRFRDGAENQEGNDWFNEAVRLVSRSVKLTQSYLTHTTTGAVDKIRLDLTAPSGLVQYNDQGKALNISVTMDVQYRLVGDTTWLPLPVHQMASFAAGGNTLVPYDFIGVNIGGLGTGGGALDYSYSAGAEYSSVGSGVWIPLGSKSGTYQAVSTPVVAPTSPGTALADPGYNVALEAEVPAGVYEVRSTGSGAVSSAYGLPVGGSSTYTMSGSSTRAQRKSLESIVLPRGEYEVRIKRNTADSLDSQTVDDIYLTDVGEIDTSVIKYGGTANLSARIKVTDQINNTPKITALYKLSLLKEYDRDGVLTFERWSNNPAWVVIDILTNELRGAGMPLSRFDWPMWVELAEHCEAEGLKFNGIFDYGTNIWEAAQNVLRCGHAQFVRLGTKWSLAIDRASDPVMLFNDSNMYKDTMSVDWVPMTDRANEIQLSYPDENDGFKKKTIRLIDNDIGVSGEASKISSYSQMGVTNVIQASAEAEYQLRRNRLLKKSMTFDAPLEAIGLTIGDVALIQHQAGDYSGGTGGKLKAGSSVSSLKLDRPVAIESGKSYSVLLYHSAINRYAVSITSIVGKNVFVTGLPGGTLQNVNRLRKGTADVGVDDIFDAGGGTHRIHVVSTEGLTTGAAALWSTNVIEERNVSTLSGTGIETLAMSAPFSVAPEQFTTFIFGQVTTVREPFRCIGISGSDINSRSLSFIEYNENMYLPAGTALPDPEVIGATLAKQVVNLSIQYNKYPSDGTQAQRVTAYWDAQDAIRYGGADVYAKYDGGSWQRLKTVLDVTSADTGIEDGSTVSFKVVGFDNQGRRAPFDKAPVASITSTGVRRVLGAPTDLAVDSGTFDVNGRLRMIWNAPVNEVVSLYRLDYRLLTEAEWLAIIADPTIGEPDATWTPTQEAVWDAKFKNAFITTGLSNYVSNLKVGFYQFRIRAIRDQSQSPWHVLRYDLQAPNFIGTLTGLRLDSSGYIPGTPGTPDTPATDGTPSTPDTTETFADTATVSVTVNSIPVGAGPDTYSTIAYGSVGFNEPGLASNVTVTKPAGTTAGDLLVAYVYHYDNVATWTPPAGWTLVTTGTGTSATYFSIYRKVAGGSEPASYTFAGSTGDYKAATIERYTGVDPLNPIQTFTLNSGSATSRSIGSMTSTVPNSYLAMAVFGYNLTATAAAPSGMTINYTEFGRGFGQALPTAAATGTKSTTDATDAWTAIGLILNPIVTPGAGGSTPAMPTAPSAPTEGAGPANNDTLAMDENSVGSSVNVLTNDSAVNASFAVVSFTQPTNGTVTQTSAGVLRYVPNTDFYGYDTFTYTVNWDIVTPGDPGTPGTPFIPGTPGTPASGGTNVFDGSEPAFIWDDIFTNAIGETNADDVPFLLKWYEVNILDLADNILRTEFVTEPRYTYTYDKNAVDTAGQGFSARRAITANVRAIGRQLQESAPDEITVNNPLPVRSGAAVINGTTFTLPLPNDLDFAGYRVWYKTTDDINHLVDPYFDVSTNIFKAPSSPGQTVYLKYAPFDRFDRDNATLDVSGSFSAIGEEFSASNLNLTNFASGLEPVGVVDVLPDPSGYVGPSIVILTTDSLVYRFTGSVWTSLIPASQIDGLVQAAQIAALEAGKITGQMTSAQIADLAAVKITGLISDTQLSAIAAAKITGTLSNTQIADLAAAKLTGTIVGTQIADNAITAAKINAGAITAGKIAADTITANEIAANAITANELAANAVTAGKIAAGAITAGTIAANAITATEIAAGAITAGKIAAGAIVANDIASNAITAGKIAAGAVTAGTIAALSIVAGDIAAGAITAGKIQALSIVAGDIAAGAIVAGKIQAGAISATELAVNAVTAGKVAANAITAGNINVTSLSALSANLGAVTAGSININGKFLVDSAGNVTIQSSPTGARLVLTNSTVLVYDAVRLRVRLGIW
jgi:predicted phage tail protein